MDLNNQEYNSDWIKEQERLILREIRRKKQERYRKMREPFDALFPEFKNVPIVWLIIAGICVLFNLLTLFII